MIALVFWFSSYAASDSFATPCTVVRQAPLPMGFPRQEYWSRLPFPSSGDLTDSGTELMSPALQAVFFFVCFFVFPFTTGPPEKPLSLIYGISNMSQVNLPMKQKRIHTENGHDLLRGKGGGGVTEWEFGVSRCKLLYVLIEQIYSSGSVV